VHPDIETPSAVFFPKERSAGGRDPKGRKSDQEPFEKFTAAHLFVFLSLHFHTPAILD